MKTGKRQKNEEVGMGRSDFVPSIHQFPVTLVCVSSQEVLLVSGKDKVSLF